MRESQDSASGSERPCRAAWGLGPLDWRLVGLLAGLKLLIHLLSSNAYGYFRDELYFLDCARHLGWGYVDDAPLIAGYAKISLLLGGSLPAVRLLPALAGAATVGLSVALARKMGGGRFAQGLAGLCVLGAPIFLGMDSILCVGAFEPLFWMGCASVLIELVRTGNARLWIWFGVLAGLGLENKYAMLVFGLAALTGIVLTPLRRELRRPWIWLAGLIALLLFLPTLLWQIRNGYPLLEDMANIRHLGKNVVLGPWAFIQQQIQVLNPLLFPIWFAGLCSLMFGRQSRLRILGWLYLCMLTLMIALQAKDYYLAAIYPMLFAAGAVSVEDWLARREWSRRLWPRVALLSIISGVTVVLIPAMLPILSPGKLLAYQRSIGLKSSKQEVRHEGPLDQRLGDQFGWPELTAEVARIYHGLSPEERAHTAIYAASYGEAGAINQLGPPLGLPPAICAHQAHFLWGPPAQEASTYICLGCGRRGLERRFTSVQIAAEHHHPWGMAEENGPIYLCRGPKESIRELWPKLKLWN